MHPVHASVSQLRVTLWHAATRWLCPLSQTVSVVCAVHVSCGPGGCLACRGGPFMLCPPAGFTSDGPCTCWWTFRGSRQLGSYDCTRPKSCGARFGCCACFEAAACACPRGGGGGLLQAAAAKARRCRCHVKGGPAYVLLDSCPVVGSSGVHLWFRVAK